MQTAGAVLTHRTERAKPEFKRELQLFSLLWALSLFAVFFLHFPHLLADFPNYSPWMDYSKYTDEGWYGGAAVRYYLTGHWFVPGDFNPAVALPIWPLLLAGVFHFTGVSLAAARTAALVVFGVNLLLSCAVLRTQAPRWVAMLGVSILVTSPFLFAFSRLALLEPVMMMLLLASWWLALRLPMVSARVRLWQLLAIGFLLCLTVLAKTTAVFILPSTLYLVAHAGGFRWRNCLRAFAIIAASALVPWSLWYFLLIRPHYRFAWQYLFEVNKWPQPGTLAGWIAAFWYAFHAILWISPALCAAAAIIVLLHLCRARGLKSLVSSVAFFHPLAVASLLAAVGCIFFAGWHNNPQPRYYQAVIYPLAFIIAEGVGQLAQAEARWRRSAAWVGVTILAGICLAGLYRISGYLLHPEYTWLRAATALTRYINDHPAPNRMLLSVSGAEISLMTGLPTLCDDFGTWDLPYRLHTYQPAWFATWNAVDPGTLEDLETLNTLERVAAFPAFDDPDRNVLVLYRLHPLPPQKQNYSPREESLDNAGK